MLGKPENTRFLHLSLFQGAGKPVQKLDAEMVASDNPLLENVFQDPILFCTGFKKNRFYMFTRREPEETHKLVISECEQCEIQLNFYLPKVVSLPYWC